MNKKIVAILLSVCMLLLPACSLAHVPDGNGDEGKFEEDYLCGFFIYFEEHGDDGTKYFPTDDFLSVEAAAVYAEKIKVGNSDNSYIEIKNKGNCITEVNTTTVNGGFAAPNGKIKIEAGLYFTFELSDKFLRMNGVYFNEENYTLSTKQEELYKLHDYENGSVGIEQNMKISATSQDGQKEEVTYGSEMKLYLKMIDYLAEVRIIEFDKNNGIIKETSVNKEDKVDKIDYRAGINCEYIMIEEEYDIMHGSKTGTKYTERTLINRELQKQRHLLHFPRGNGLTDSIRLNFEFVN